MKMREIIQNRKILYILLALLVAVAIWIFVDMFGNNGSYFSKEITITEVPITYTGEDDLADRGLMLVDEGTSALDQKNADIVEKSLLSNPDLTLILISHHLSDERKAQFDHVYELTPASSIV